MITNFNGRKDEINNSFETTGCKDVTDIVSKNGFMVLRRRKLLMIQIIHMITEEEIDKIKYLNNDKEKITSHAEDTAELDVAFCYMEQQPDALLQNALFLKSLLDNAARKRISAQKQTISASFFKREIK